LCVYMPVAQSPAHYINSTKGCPSITESFPLVVFCLRPVSEADAEGLGTTICMLH
jgi:hypothetical protein